MNKQIKFEPYKTPYRSRLWQMKEHAYGNIIHLDIFLRLRIVGGVIGRNPLTSPNVRVNFVGRDERDRGLIHRSLGVPDLDGLDPQ
jgi:hypothetical protein